MKLPSRVLHILTGTEDMTHRYWWYDSRVLHILTGTEDMTHGYCISSRVLRIWLTGTEDMTHGYWWYDLRVMHTFTDTEDMTHRYWWYDSRVMHILTGNAYPHGYCIPSRVLHIVYTGWMPKLCVNVPQILKNVKNLMTSSAVPFDAQINSCRKLNVTHKVNAQVTIGQCCLNEIFMLKNKLLVRILVHISVWRFQQIINLKPMLSVCPERFLLFCLFPEASFTSICLPMVCTQAFGHS